MYELIKSVFVFFLFFILPACAGMQNPYMTSVAMDMESKKFEPVPGKARIYIIRPSKFGGTGVFINPTINKMVTGHLTSGSYLMLEVLPGNYLISAAGNLEAPEDMEIKAEADKLYFVKMYPKAKASLIVSFSPGLNNEIIDTEEGQKLVLEYKRYKTIEYKSFLQNLTPDIGKSKIYIIRPHTAYGSASNHKLSPTVDNKVIGSLEKGSCLVTEVSPGPHVISAADKFEGQYTIEMDASKGKTYFVKVTLSMGWAFQKMKWEIVNQEEGSKMVGDCKKMTD